MKILVEATKHGPEEAPEDTLSTSGTAVVKR